MVEVGTVKRVFEFEIYSFFLLSVIGTHPYVDVGISVQV
jgi:hypothetical protein